MASGPSRGFDDGPSGYTYAAVLVRLDDPPAGRPLGREDVLHQLRAVRFTGWVGHVEDGWLVAVAGAGAGSVAAGRDVLGLGVVAGRAALRDGRGRPGPGRPAAGARGVVGPEEVGRYASDPSYGADDDVLPDPLGVEYAEAFAVACGQPDTAEELGELLAEEVDPDSMIESERLARILRLLHLPSWIVAAASLPRDVPSGPRARDLARLGAGRTGLLGRLSGRAAEVVRRRRSPPPAFPDAPRGSAEPDPWGY